MIRLPRAVPLLLVVSLLASCTMNPVTGALEISVTGLPAGETGSVTVSGPNGYEEVVSGDETLANLRPGSYTLAPAQVDVDNAGHDGVELFDAAEQNVQIVGNETTEAEVDYSYSGFAISDPDDDAVGVAGAELVYEVVEMSSQVTADAVEITLTLIDSQTDLSELIGFIELDIDQDDTTGQPSEAEGFCPDSNDVGSEYVVDYTSISRDTAVIEDTAGVADPAEVAVTVDGNQVTFSIPLSVIADDDGRMDAAAIIGNSEEPTDCVPLGGVVF